MKGLIHKKWLSIPVTVFLVLALTTGAVFAGGFAPLGEDQIITQIITEPVSPLDYGSITAPSFRLTSINTGDTHDPQALQETLVIVDVGEDSVDMWLHMSLAGDVDLYDDYLVGIVSIPQSNVMGTWLQLQVSKKAPQASIQLTVVGTYTFNIGVVATAGTTEGTAHVKVTYSLEATAD